MELGRFLELLLYTFLCFLKKIFFFFSWMKKGALLFRVSWLRNRTRENALWSPVPRAALADVASTGAGWAVVGVPSPRCGGTWLFDRDCLVSHSSGPQKAMVRTLRTSALSWGVSGAEQMWGLWHRCTCAHLCTLPAPASLPTLAFTWESTETGVFLLVSQGGGGAGGGGEFTWGETREQLSCLESSLKLSVSPGQEVLLSLNNPWAGSPENRADSPVGMFSLRSGAPVLRYLSWAGEHHLAGNSPIICYSNPHPLWFSALRYKVNGPKANTVALYIQCRERKISPSVPIL